MDPMKIEWVGNALLHDDKTRLFEPDKYYTPVVRLAAVDAILEESVWAMETIRELIMLKLDRKNQTWAELEKECLAHPYYQHAKRFLARPDVREWQERQKETGETT